MAAAAGVISPVHTQRNRLKMLPRLALLLAFIVGLFWRLVDLHMLADLLENIKRTNTVTGIVTLWERAMAATVFLRSKESRAWSAPTRLITSFRKLIKLAFI
jgi:hypothetical protein